MIKLRFHLASVQVSDFDCMQLYGNEVKVCFYVVKCPLKLQL